MSGWATAITAIAPVAGGIIGQSQQNSANRNSANRAMNFEERMSNTAHQREVDDLRAAGLNPLLSANSGAASAMGPAPQMSNQIGEGIKGGIASAIDAVRVKNESRLLEGELGVKASTINAQSAQAMRDASTARQNDTATAALQAQIKAIKSEAAFREQQSDIDRKNIMYDNIQRRLQNGLTTLNTGKSLITPFMRGEIPGVKPGGGGKKEPYYRPGDFTKELKHQTPWGGL